MNKDKALLKLKELIDQTPEVLTQRRFSQTFNKWILDSQTAVVNIFGEDSRQVQELNSIEYLLGMYSTSTPDSSFEKAFREGVETTCTTLKAFFDEVAEYWEDKNQTLLIEPSQIIYNLCKRFHLTALSLKNRYSNRPTFEIKDEYDVQDLFYALLKLNFDDVRKEEYTPSYAGGNSRVDFLLKKEKIVIELKMTRANLKDNQIGEQLLVDADRYKTHNDCKRLVFFVYDPDHFIENPNGLMNDLEDKNTDFPIDLYISSNI